MSVRICGLPLSIAVQCVSGRTMLYRNDTHECSYMWPSSLHCCAVIRSDGIYHVTIDQSPFVKGNLLEDLTPPIIPSEEIEDPTDKMPSDWDEREK